MSGEARVATSVQFDDIFGGFNRLLVMLTSFFSSDDTEAEDQTTGDDDSLTVPADDNQKPPDLGVSVSDNSTAGDVFGP